MMRRIMFSAHRMDWTAPRTERATSFNHFAFGDGLFSDLTALEHRRGRLQRLRPGAGLIPCTIVRSLSIVGARRCRFARGRSGRAQAVGGVMTEGAASGAKGTKPKLEGAHHEHGQSGR